MPFILLQQVDIDNLAHEDVEAVAGDNDGSKARAVESDRRCRLAVQLWCRAMPDQRGAALDDYERASGANGERER